MAKSFERPGIHGWIHEPDGVPREAMVITHGAGSNCDAPLPVAVAEVFAGDGYLVLRYDLPFRQLRPKGSPAGSQERDRDGIRLVARAMRELTSGLPLILAGHSYGGRQSTMAASEDPSLADALMLLSYPLHPPKKPEQLRTEHFPSLRTPSLFVHGTSDEFGSVEEMTEALKLIPAPVKLVICDRAGHSLAPRIAPSLPAELQALPMRS